MVQDLPILEDDHPNLDPSSAGRDQIRTSRHRRLVVAVVATVVSVGVASAVLLLVSRSQREQRLVAASVRCSVYWRDSDRSSVNHAGDVVLTIRNPPLGLNDQRVGAGSMTFGASVPNLDPAFRRGPGSDGGDLAIEVADSLGRPVSRQLYQIWEGPTENFGGDTGFTGLVYVNDPATGAEVQYFCIAVP